MHWSLVLFLGSFLLTSLASFFFFFFFPSCYSVIFAITQLTLFMVLALFSTFYYYSYPTAVYSCRNICNNHSRCDHTLHPTHSIYNRMRLHRVSMTCTQAGLKHSPSKASLNSLTPDHRVTIQQKELRPNNTRKAPTPLMLKVWDCFILVLQV